MKKYSFFLLLLALNFSSCSDYQKILKSNDSEFKYNKAIAYFEKGDFIEASTLFEDVSADFKGTDRSETVLNYMAKSYMGQKDYSSASEYYTTYVKTYPKGKFVVESKFMIGYCFYLDSPDARLDQSATHSAIAAFQEFLEVYPESDRAAEATKLLDEMNDKLAYKAYFNAKLYYNLGNYLGNNYESAVISAQNALKQFPATKYREELSFLILEAKFQQAEQSVESKKLDRYRNTIDEYYNLINEFPSGKFRKKADKIFNESKKIVKE
jgi:outer membrane protein assembly factor BamD